MRFSAHYRLSAGAIGLAAFTLLMSGCNNAEETNGGQQQEANAESNSRPESSEAEDPGKGKRSVSAFLDNAKKILDERAKAGSKGAEQASKFMSDQLGNASEATSQIAGDAATWANDAFESLKDKGLTSADSAKDWLTEDIRNINALKYKIVKVSMDDLEAVEDQLNQLGALRWNCFHATEQDGNTILFFKKERRSILKNIPVKDMLRLVPLMNNGGE